LKWVPWTREDIDELNIRSCKGSDELDGEELAQVRSCDLERLEAEVLFG
jgi:hypothetical protein